MDEWKVQGKENEREKMTNLETDTNRKGERKEGLRRNFGLCRTRIGHTHLTHLGSEM